MYKLNAASPSPQTEQDASGVAALVADVVCDFLARNNFISSISPGPSRRCVAHNPDVHVTPEVHVKRRRLTASASAHWPAADHTAILSNPQEEERHPEQSLTACYATQRRAAHDVNGHAVYARPVGRVLFALVSRTNHG